MRNSYILFCLFLCVSCQDVQDGNISLKENVNEEIMGFNQLNDLQPNNFEGSPLSFSSADFNNDHVLDLLVIQKLYDWPSYASPYKQIWGELILYTGDDQGNFNFPIKIARIQIPRFCEVRGYKSKFQGATADFDGDGKIDLLGKCGQKLLLYSDIMGGKK